MPRHRSVAVCVALAQSLAVFAQSPPVFAQKSATLIAGPLTSASAPVSGRTTRQVVFGTVQGTALTWGNVPLPNRVVRLRDTRTGRSVAMQITDDLGLFTFRDVDPGEYVVELLDSDKHVAATSQMVTVNPGETVSTIVKLPQKARPLALLWHNASAIALVAGSAVAAGVLAMRPEDCVSPPCEN